MLIDLFLDVHLRERADVVGVDGVVRCPVTRHLLDVVRVTESPEDFRRIRIEARILGRTDPRAPLLGRLRTDERRHPAVRNCLGGSCLGLRGLRGSAGLRLLRVQRQSGRGDDRTDTKRV